MTLTDRWNDLKYAPGHIEAIMIEDLVKEVDSLRSEVNALKEAIKLQSEFNEILKKLLNSMRDSPTYGPMLEDEDDDTLTWNHEAPKPIGKVLKTEMTNDGVEFTVRSDTFES